MLDEAELITWPDPAAAVIAFLQRELRTRMGWPNVAVSTQVRQGPHVQVLRTGGPVRDLVWLDAQLTLDARAGDGITASRLAADCLTLLLAAGRAGALDEHQIGEVNAFASPQDNPDPTTSGARYSATYTVPFRGTTERTS